MGGWWIIKLETQCLRQKSKLETQALRLGLGFLVFVRMIWIGLVGWSALKTRPFGYTSNFAYKFYCIQSVHHYYVFIKIL